MLRVGIKYCGGCNPEYDRVAIVEQIKKRLAGKVSFVPAESEGVDIILAVHGCKTACADVSGFERVKIQTITNMEDGEKSAREIIEIEAHITAR
jgi:hypothetical protein